MGTIEYDKLVELITKEVMRIADENGVSAYNKEKALVIGRKDTLPIVHSSKYSLVSFDEIGDKADVSAFERIYISELTLTELCDIALGRDETPRSSAVINALLSGKEVFILESSLPHRKFAGKGSRELFKQYEGYVNRIISFGSVLIRDNNAGTKNKNMNAFADNCYDKVVTEQIAKQLVDKCENGVIKLRKGTVITPSAKDVFNHSDKTVEFV